MYLNVHCLYSPKSALNFLSWIFQFLHQTSLECTFSVQILKKINRIDWVGGPSSLEEGGREGGGWERRGGEVKMAAGVMASCLFWAVGEGCFPPTSCFRFFWLLSLWSLFFLPVFLPFVPLCVIFGCCMLFPNLPLLLAIPPPSPTLRKAPGDIPLGPARAAAPVQKQNRTEPSRKRFGLRPTGHARLFPFQTKCDGFA